MDNQINVDIGFLKENNERGQGIFMWTWDKYFEKNKRGPTFI